MTTKLVYIGEGAFIPGVPARDLTGDEVELYGGVEQLLESGLYVIQEDNNGGH